MLLEIHIYLLCYNESIIIGHTIDHYQNKFKNCKITILDNNSTDTSVEIALNKGCQIIYWSSNGIDDTKYIDFKNNIWKKIPSNKENIWIIVADMDEWLCITDEELEYENNNGTSILTTIGYNMIGESQREELTDIDLHTIEMGLYWPNESKSICFKRCMIEEMNYKIGAHECNPLGKIQYSQKKYVIKHMEPLGVLFLIQKYKSRYERTKEKRDQGEWWAGLHYSDNIVEIEKRYNEQYKNAISIKSLL